MSARVASLNVLFAEIPDVGGTVGVTSIDKRPISETRLVTTNGVAGDKRSDLKHHGSPDQAVYAYAQEDYSWWSEQLKQTLSPGQFGENITTTGIDLNNLVIGSVIKCGGAKLRVTKPRIPCSTFSRWMQQDQWVKRFSDEGRVGTYLAVLEPGEITTGDEFVVESVPDHGVTILDYFQVHTGDRDFNRVTKCANCPDIDSDTREKFSKFISQ